MRHLVARVAFAAAVATITASSAAAQQHQHEAKKEPSHDMKGDAMSPWKEMDAFHAILGPTYHPAAEKGNLVPLKAKAADLADAAKVWSLSAAPATCASDEIKQSVASLATSTAALAEQVKSGADEKALTNAITTIHDTFEKVEKGCVAKHDMKEMKH